MIWLTSIILLTAIAGLWRISHAASTADRLLGIQMLGTTGIAFLLVLAEWQQEAVWRIVALLLALLAAVVTVALVQLLRGQSQ
ncbi:MAG: monovalent cation/H+ antiporter complex subunit F [Pseudohongiella sp.]|nr:monovalent cation/H+ antiporter complex subunit F [Pseudohongiella sp.]MDP2126038.1 monovalent cation/H+ antiporter complex subunit F [Pseudohongiella sp.]